jgi:hypothetical protein
MPIGALAAGSSSRSQPSQHSCYVIQTGTLDFDGGS